MKVWQNTQKLKHKTKQCNTQHTGCPNMEVRKHSIIMGGTKLLMPRKVILEVYAHFLYCSVLSLGGKVNTRRMSQPDMESIKYFGHWKLLCELSKFNDYNLLGY